MEESAAAAETGECTADCNPKVGSDKDDDKEKEDGNNYMEETNEEKVYKDTTRQFDDTVINLEEITPGPPDQCGSAVPTDIHRSGREGRSCAWAWLGRRDPPPRS